MKNFGIIPPKEIKKYIGLRFTLIIDDEIMMIKIISYDDKDQRFLIDGLPLSKTPNHGYVLKNKILSNPCRILDVLQVAIKNGKHKKVYEKYEIEIICFNIDKKINKILNL